jgi:Arc/MetJ family transcription regulator
MGNVKRTSMFLDRELVAQAAEALGTSGATETVHAALRQVVVIRAGTELADLIEAGNIRVPTRQELRDWDADSA